MKRATKPVFDEIAASIPEPPVDWNRVGEVAKAYAAEEAAEKADPGPCSFSTIPDFWKLMVELIQDDDGSEDWKSRPKGPIKTDWYNARWIPFTDGSSGDHLCIDLDPPKKGTLGQIIFSWHEVGAYCQVANSFGAMIHAFANRLEEGLFAFSEEEGVALQLTMTGDGSCDEFFRALGSKYV